MAGSFMWTFNSLGRSMLIQSRRVFLLACSACFGGMLFGWDIGAIGGVVRLRVEQLSRLSNIELTEIAHPSCIRENLRHGQTISCGCCKPGGLSPL